MLRDRIKEEEVRIQDLTTEKEDFIHELDDLRTRIYSKHGTTETLKTLKDKRKKSSMVPKDQITTK
ncbi:hypothetical protein MAR_023918 [Mya arenaria]|uniref:Uncharacterized protein n=1 Tax=Mya arenaria TaxID=6604 RepID=A0ABY7DX87_MYAAR|nr:hypothetical protein MAR_023918 [Mya arenaria]